MQNDLSIESGKNTKTKSKTTTLDSRIVDATDLDISHLVALAIKDWSDEDLVDTLVWYQYNQGDEVFHTALLLEGYYREILDSDS